MGTYGCFRERGQTDIEFFKKEFEWQKDDGSNLQVLKTHRKGNVVYVLYAVYHDGTTDKTVDVCVTSWGDDEFYYKPMNEDMGPYYYECPLDWLNKLSPPATDTAREWRLKVRQTAAQKKDPPPFDTTIRFTEPLRFNDGFEGDEFVTERWKKKAKRYRSVVNGRLYQITQITKRDWEVVDN
jgi:hypothetical protein